MAEIYANENLRKYDRFQIFELVEYLERDESGALKAGEDLEECNNHTYMNFTGQFIGGEFHG
jgi:hypothetical protein